MAGKPIWKYRLWEPHIAFWSAALILKLMFPSLLKWLAHDTITTLMVSVWYPLSSTVALIHRERHEQAPGEDDICQRDERQFWIDYWSLGFSVVQFIQHGAMLLPNFQHMRLQSPVYIVMMSEAKLLFFVWIFSMKSLLVWYQRYLSLEKDKEDWKDFDPLSLLKQMILPRLLVLQMTISEPISKENWQRLVHSNAQRILELLVVLQFLTEEWRDYLLTLLEEGRSLLLLSVFLILPASLTQIGILYVKTLLPAARSCTEKGKAGQVLYLQYWILNNLLAVGLAMGAWLWWWVPFSTQIIFAVWCYITFPRTIIEKYATVEMELITFGILPGESNLAVEETKTVQALRALVKRLPSANDAEGFQWLEGEIYDDSSGSESGVVRKTRRNRKSKRTLVTRSKSSPAKILLEKVNSPSLHHFCDDEHRFCDDDEDSFINTTKDNQALSLPSPTSMDVDNRACPGPFSSADKKVEDAFQITPTSTLSSSTGINPTAPPMSMETEHFGFAQMHPPISLKEDSDRTLPPSMSLIEESDDSSQFSAQAVCNVQVTSSHSSDESVHEEHLKPRKAPPTPEDYEIPIPMRYKNARVNLLMPSKSDEKTLCLSPLSRLTTPTFASSPPTTAEGQNWESGFYLSDVDTTASSMIERVESLESCEESAMYGGMLFTSAAVAAEASHQGLPMRRSARLRRLQHKHSQQTESLLDLEGPSIDSTPSQAVLPPFDCRASNSPSKRSISHKNGNRSRRHEMDTNEVRNHRQFLPVPKYVRVDASGPCAESPERRARRGRR